MRFLWALLFILAGCGGHVSDAPINSAGAQTVPTCTSANVAPGWFGLWQISTQSWCGLVPTTLTDQLGTFGPVDVVHTADAGIPGPYAAAIAHSSFAINDNPHGWPAWGHYFECDNMLAGTGPCFGVEIDVASDDPNAGPTPGLWIACGSGWIRTSREDCNAEAIGIGTNPHTWPAGWDVKPGAIQGMPQAPAGIISPGQCIMGRQPDGSLKPLLCN